MFDPETERVLRVALEMTRAALGLTDHHANGIIAKQLIELAKAGERNPDRLYVRCIGKIARASVRRLRRGCRGIP